MNINIRSKNYPAFRGIAIIDGNMQRWVKWNAAGEVLDEYADTIVLNFNTIECNTGLTDVNGEWIFENDKVEILDKGCEPGMIETVKYEREAFGLFSTKYQKFTPFCKLGGIKQTLQIVGNWHEDNEEKENENDI